MDARSDNVCMARPGAHFSSKAVIVTENTDFLENKNETMIMITKDNQVLFLSFNFYY